MTLRVKICGITNLDDALCAVENGADLLGFIQYPPSPRYITPEAAADIINQLPSEIETVGVFVNETADSIKSAAGIAGFTTIQLHGHESPDILSELTSLNVIKALGIASETDIVKIDSWKAVPLLIDTPCPEHGGSGVVGNWNLAATIAKSYTMYLAGGLNPENVADAVAKVGPYGVDVSSGVEAAKGVKDHARVKAFIDHARMGVISS